jgi:hypothetical protein
MTWRFARGDYTHIPPPPPHYDDRDREDGGSWRYSARWGDGERYGWADTPEDVIHLYFYDPWLRTSLPGEPGSDEWWDAAISRVDGLVTRWTIQALQRAQADGAAVPATEREAIHSARREPPDGGRWDGLVPMFLLFSDYEPYTDRVPPTGNVIMVDPVDEDELLALLREHGGLEVTELG